jgi:hypothetical protein
MLAVKRNQDRGWPGLPRSPGPQKNYIFLHFCVDGDLKFRYFSFFGTWKTRRNPVALINEKTMKMFRHLLCIAATMLLVALSANAHPYASSVTNNSGTIQFILNENADSVSVAFDNATVTNVLGALPKGANSFSLGGHTNYAIIVTKAGSGSFTQLTDDSSNAVQFIAPRGVGVNVNPQRSAFGRIYVVNSWPSVTPDNLGTTNATGDGRLVGRGIYAINQDGSDALGQGTNALVGDMVFGTSVRYSPYRVCVGPDDSVYVEDLSGSYTASLNPATTYSYSAAGGGVWWASADFSSSGPLFDTNDLGTVFDGGLGLWVTGSIAANNLVVYTDDWGLTGNTAGGDFLTPPSIWKYTYDSVNNPIPIVNPPDGLFIVGLGINGVLGDMAIHLPTGYIYAEQDRTAAAGDSTGTGEANNNDAELYVYDPTGTNNLWESGIGGANIYDATFGIAISPDGNWLACATGFGSTIITHITNGIPDLSTVVTLQEEPNPTAYSALTVKRGAVFDAADNLITSLPQTPNGSIDAPTAANPAVVREYSLGFSSLATTSNDITGTNGTFSLVLSAPPAPPSRPATITSVTAASGSLTLNWTTASSPSWADDTTASFTVQSTSDLTVPFSDISPAATITQPGGAGTAFQATVTPQGPTTFYRIRHL